MVVEKSYIGESLKRARKAKRLSQLALAQKLGFQQGTISRAESGHNLRVDTLLEIARALDLDLVLVPRSLRPVINALRHGSKLEHTSIYTGAGDEPYYEGEIPRESTSGNGAVER